MKKIISSLFMMTSSIAFCQSKGVIFQHFDKWSQVINNAKKEDKYIFIDFYATWCVPCKKMDKEVYSNDTVGTIMNEKFISVKIQMDSTEEDLPEIKDLYALAHSFKDKYNIHSFPTYLFLNNEGVPLHREIGYKNKHDFVRLVNDVFDKRKQYYTIVQNYRHGIKDYILLPLIAQMAANFGENELADTLASDYIDNYLFKQTKDKLLKKSSIQFISRFAKNTQGRSFAFFYTQPSAIDSIMGKGYTERMRDFLISKEYVYPFLNSEKVSGKSPDWKQMEQNIKKRFGLKYADRNVLTAKSFWFASKEDWRNYIETMITRVDKYGPFGFGVVDFDFNNHAWDIFLHSNDKKQLEKALIWSNKAVALASDSSNRANWMDTNANILYKLGRKEEAIEIQQRVVDMSLGTSGQKEFTDNLEKMKKGLPTWIEQ